nr:permease [Corynebacterium lactis]
MSADTRIPRPHSTTQSVLWLGISAVCWALLYWANGRVWTALILRPSADQAGRLQQAIHFFFYDSGKVLLLLFATVFAIGLVRTTLNPEAVREYLLDKPLWLSLLLAVLLGAITPFCSCSSIPLFIGFVAAGVPLAVTLAFLLASPLVNEVAVVMLAQSFGWPITVAYVASGLGMAMLIGAILSRFDLDDQVKDFIRSTPTSRLHATQHRPTLAERIDASIEETKEIVGRIWKWVLLGVGAGALIHGWIPADFISTYAGSNSPLAVLLVVALGVPLYSNAAGVIPIAEALWSKGMATGTVLSFMMATVALSIPEFVLLKQVLKNRLLGIYAAAVSVAIIIIGVSFNMIFH